MCQELYIIQRVVGNIFTLNVATNTILTPLDPSKSQETLILDSLIVRKIAQKHFLKGEMEGKRSNSAKQLFWYTWNFLVLLQPK